MSAAEKETLRVCLRNLGALEGCKTTFEPEWNLDGSCGRIRLVTPWDNISFRAFLHLRITPKTATLILRQMEESKSPQAPLLLTDFLSENLATRLRNRKINYMDSCGNAFLNHPPMYVEISGRPRKSESVSAARPFQQAGLKLIFVLLANPDAVSWTCRRLAAEAGIALGAVSLVLQRLEKTGYLERSGRRKRVLKSPEALLRRWELGFSENLREKLMLHTCRFSSALEITDLPQLLREKGLGETILTGGELGAHLLFDHPKPRSAVLYLPGDTLKTMLRLQLVPDPEGNVDLMKIFSPSNTWQGWHPERLMLADPLLMHADIAFRGALSTALEKKFMEDFLQPRFKPEADSKEGTG
ncbi:MAG: hypothetical protein JXK94_10010 [Deltaproteobacteria bacterium]|nr:hypothetical protein [Deltaproteobacteria bacterium]